MKADTSTRIIVLSGQSGSGKTSLAKELVQKLDASFASFGSFVRLEAIRRGIELDRNSLQNLGQALIAEFGSDEFVKEVLIHRQGNSSTITVLDGVRSVEIWRSVQKLVSRSVLVYLDVEEDKRIDRLIKRDDLDVHSIRLMMQHPMETNIPDLRAYSDIILYNNSFDIMVSEILKLVMLKGFNLDKG